GWCMIYDNDETLFDNFNLRKKLEMRKRADKVRDIKYAKCMRLSTNYRNKTIAIITEDVGLTMANIIDKYISDERYNKIMDGGFFVTIFLRLLIEVYLMHAAGISHLDLHANNFTFNILDINLPQTIPEYH